MGSDGLIIMEVPFGVIKILELENDGCTTL